ncbi:MAG: replication initiator protein A [Cyanobacteria bacterium P01_D01_bin.56]
MQQVVIQPDFFSDLPDNVPLKDDAALMEHPWFSLSKTPRFEPIHYEKNGISVKVEAGPAGMATIWDKEILVYIASIINERIERGEPIDRTIRFVAYDFLVRTGRGTGKRAYDLMINSLKRLRSTMISTDIESAHERERAGFGWIDDFHVLNRKDKNGKPVMVAVEVTISRWMFRALTIDRRVLTVDDEYFQIRKGLTKRLYEIARKHCGKQSEWTIGLEKLKTKCGVSANRELFKFKHDMLKIQKENNLPRYTFEINKGKNTDVAVFKPRKKHPIITIDSQPNQQPKKLAASINAMDKARKKYPGFDVEYIEREWKLWAEEQSDPVKNPDQAFLGFCERYVSQQK